MKDIHLKIPGKLFVAGEYAVVEKGHSAIIVAVDRFIYLTIKETKNPYGEIFSKDYTEKPEQWIRRRNRFWLKKQNYRLKYIRSAIHTTERYLHEMHVPLRFFDLDIESELKSDRNQKFGLGSSGAITVGTVRALLQFYGQEDNDLLVYKLAVLAQINLKVNSSFGDLAASTYQGWIKYQNFDHDFVLNRFKRIPTRDLVHTKWPSLEIKNIPLNAEFRFLVGWTGKPASSNYLVGNVQTKKEQSQEEYSNFLKESKLSVELLAESLTKNDTEGIQKALRKNRQALLEMGKETNVMIETKELKKLIEIAENYRAVAKTSGAGGGDSGIAFVFEPKDLPFLVKDWHDAGIRQLDLKVYPKVNEWRKS